MFGFRKCHKVIIDEGDVMPESLLEYFARTVGHYIVISIILTLIACSIFILIDANFLS